MGGAKRSKVASTEQTTNLDIEVTGELSLDEMESVLLEAATELGMYFSRVTVLGTRRYPGNRHWHLKQDPRRTGCLDVTYWPAGPLMWISMRNYEPEWVHDSGRQLGSLLDRRLATQPDREDPPIGGRPRSTPERFGGPARSRATSSPKFPDVEPVTTPEPT